MYTAYDNLHIASPGSQVARRDAGVVHAVDSWERAPSGRRHPPLRLRTQGSPAPVCNGAQAFLCNGEGHGEG